MARPVPAPFTTTDVRRILTTFGIDDDGAPEVLPLSAGFGMSLARVRTGGHDLVLKRINDELPVERTRYALAYHARLHAAGIPCPALVATADGSLEVAVDGKRFSLQAWCPGEALLGDRLPDERGRHVRQQIGALLGRVHAAASPEVAALAPAICRRDVRRMFRQPARVEAGLPWSRGGYRLSLLWLRLRERGAFGSDLRRAVPLIRRARRALKAAAVHDDPRLDPAVPVHGDFNYENLLFEGDQLRYLLDFDNAGIISRAYDVASTAAVICPGRGHEDVFLSAYEAASGLPRPDEDILRAGVLLRLLNSLTLQVVAYTRRRVADPEQARQWISRLIRSLGAELEAAGR